MPTVIANIGDVVFVNSEQGPDPWEVIFPAEPMNNGRVTVCNTADDQPQTPNYV